MNKIQHTPHNKACAMIGNIVMIFEPSTIRGENHNRQCYIGKFGKVMKRIRRPTGLTELQCTVLNWLDEKEALLSIEMINSKEKLIISEKSVMVLAMPSAMY